MGTVSAPLLQGTPDGAAFGEFLRQARERRGLTLQQISSATKIPWRHLDALEHGLLNAVPGGTYRRGEIRAYAEVVGLDKAIALERLDRALRASNTPALEGRTSSPAPARGRSLLLVALIALAGTSAMITWNRAAAKPSAAPARVEPLLPVRTIDAWGLMSLPFVLPEAPITGKIAASAAPEVSTPSSRLDAVLTITSEPPGARVTVDGIAWGVTPVRVQLLSPGDRRVRVTLPDFAAVERRVRIPDDRSSTSLHVVLTATPER